MGSDGDDLQNLLSVLQRGMVKASSAMDGEAAMPDEKERRQARHDRLEAQLAMLEAAWRAYQIGVKAPRPPLPAEAAAELEDRYGFVPGTYAGTVGRPSGTRAVMVEQSLKLAMRVTRAELAAEDSPLDRAFMAAIFRICCATVIGALVGAPLGALAAHESIVLKMAEAGVVVGLGATAAEIIEPISVRLPREPAAPPDVASYHLAMTASRDIVDLVLSSDLQDDTAPGHLNSLGDPATAPEIPSPATKPEPDNERPWHGPIDPPVRPPFGGPGPC